MNKNSIVAAYSLAVLAAGCGGPPGGAPTGPPAMPVEVVTLALRPVEQKTDYVGVVKSRRSTTVQPQVEGVVTRILVRSGDRVETGAPLAEIDPRRQQATVASLESQRASRQADLRLAQQEAARMKTLLEAGAASQAERDRAEAGLATAAAQLEAIEAQVAEQQVALGHHRVTAPVAGVVGDIPVRVGDSVTRATALTTLDQKAGLEVYIQVPVGEGQKLKVGLPVHLVDDHGGRVLATARLSFVAAAVDATTQSVLAKAVLAEPGLLRTEQFVRVQIVWTEAPALTAPVVALNRVNGQFFAFVAEAGDSGALVARQRAVEAGAIVGNDYVVASGLQPGERLIVSGVQKIRDGAPVTITPAGSGAGVNPSPAPGA